MPTKIKENWIVLVAVMLLTLFGNILFYSFKEADSTLDNAASMEYVDSENDKQDRKIEGKVDKDDYEKFLERFEIMDERIYEIWKAKHSDN
jgi:hypothetical protein